MKLRLLMALSCLSGCSTAADQPAASEPRYLYYLHGRIVEDLGPRGVSPTHGAYDYPGIMAALESDGIVVVSEVRPSGTDVSAYADQVVADIRGRLEAGTPQSHITVAGASKGAVIAALVSTRLGEDQVRYVLLAGCNDWLVRTHNPSLTGEILSIFEASDEIGGTCAPVVRHSPRVRRFEEIRLETGLGHGFLYRPLQSWVSPALAWARR